MCGRTHGQHRSNWVGMATLSGNSAALRARRRKGHGRPPTSLLFSTVHNRVGKKLTCRSLFCIFLMRKWHWIVSWRPKDQSGIGHASLCWFSSVTGLSRLRFIVTIWYSYFFMVVLLIVTPKSIPLTSSHGLPPAEHFKTLAWRQACKSVQQVVQGIYLRKGGKTCRRHVFLLWSLTSLTQK